MTITDLYPSHWYFDKTSSATKYPSGNTGGVLTGTTTATATEVTVNLPDMHCCGHCGMVSFESKDNRRAMLSTLTEQQQATLKLLGVEAALDSLCTGCFNALSRLIKKS